MTYRNAISNTVYFVLVIAMGFVVLDPYDTIGHNMDYVSRMVLCIGCVIPACVFVASFIHPLRYSAATWVTFAVWIASAVWLANVAASFKGVYGNELSLGEMIQVFIYSGVGVLPFFVAQWSWIYFICPSTPKGDGNVTEREVKNVGAE